MSSIPVIFGWGKKGKECGYIGIDKCPNCKNYTHLKLYEYANTVNAYFIPVAKFNKKLYLVCPVCDAGWELKGELKEEMLDLSLNSLSPKTTQDIWQAANDICNENFADYMEKYGEKTIDKLIEKCVEEISKTIKNKKYIKKVVIKYLEFSFDNDMPK